MRFLRKVREKAQAVGDFLQPMQIPLHTAYTSFYLILSLFPFLLLFLGLLRYTSMDIAQLKLTLQGWLPKNLVPIANSLVDSSYYHSSTTVVSVSAVAVLFSSSQGMYGVRNGLTAVYTRSPGQGYLRNLGFSMIYTVLFLVMLLVTLLVYLFGTTLLDYLQMTTTPALLLLMDLIDLRWVLLLFVQSALFTLMYAYLPSKPNSVRESWPGAITASLGWLLYSQLFSNYVDYITAYTTIYGSVYILVLGMLWLYFCISIFFYGAALNCWLSHRKARRGG